MADSIPVLWPDDITVSVVSPQAILRAQVAPLQKMTKGMLRVLISTTTSEGSENVLHSMRLVAPALNHYEHEVLTVSHARDRVYPAKIMADCFEPEPEAGDYDSGQLADSQETFIKHLRTVLKSQEVRSIIDSLLARMNDQEGKPTEDLQIQE